MTSQEFTILREILDELKRIRMALEKSAIYEPGNCQDTHRFPLVPMHASVANAYNQNQPMEQQRYAD